MNKQIVMKHLLEYLKLRKISFKKHGAVIMLECPYCKAQANIMPNTDKIKCFKCDKVYTILDIAKKVDNLPDDENTIIQHLKELLNIKIITKIDEDNLETYFNYLEKNGFSLIPIVKNDKIPIEKDWTNSEHKDKEEWLDWHRSELNIGILTGIKSNITVIDFDILNKKEKIEFRFEKISEERKKELLTKRENGLKLIYEKFGKILGEPLVQDNLGGQHLVYQYEEDLPKTGITLENIHIDLENDGGYILIAPSKLGITSRKFKELKPIPKMSKELKELIQSKITTPKITNNEQIKEAIETENFKINTKDLELINNNLEGCCNSSFIKLGGILRKQLNTQNTSYVLHVLNKHLLEHPMKSQTISAMVTELNKYDIFDEKVLANEVYKYLRDDVEEANRTEIAMAIVGTNRGEEKKRVDKVLGYLVKEEKIIKRGTKYRVIKKANWKTELINIGKPIDFKMPYFDDVMTFNQGDLLLIGSRNANGKTHIAMNIIQQLVQQEKTPYYLSLETGSRWAQLALQLGLKEGDFKWEETSNPENIELEPNAITIIDWLCPNNYAESDKLIKHFSEKLQKKRGVLIIFMQLRDNNEWLAKDLVKQFPAFACRYIYDNEDSGEYGKFILDKLRDAKINLKKFELPAQYNWETKELKLIKDE